MFRLTDRWLTAVETFCLGFGTAVAVTIATVQVVFRYIGGTGFYWAEEATVYMIVWTAFLSAGAAVRTGEHLGVEILKIALGPQYEPLLARIAAGLGLLSSVALAVYGVEFVQTAYAFGQLSPALQIPMWIVYLALPLAGVLMGVRFGQQIVNPTAWAAESEEGGL